MITEVTTVPLFVTGRPWDAWHPRADALEMFTIFSGPVDVADGWVVRRFQLKGSTTEAKEGVIVGSLAEARGLLPPGLYPIARAPEDHPSVVETWL